MILAPQSPPGGAKKRAKPDITFQLFPDEAFSFRRALLRNKIGGTPAGAFSCRNRLVRGHFFILLRLAPVSHPARVTGISYRESHRLNAINDGDRKTSEEGPRQT